jgi:hypothetical protein
VYCAGTAKASEVMVEPATKTTAAIAGVRNARFMSLGPLVMSIYRRSPHCGCILAITTKGDGLFDIGEGASHARIGEL